MSAATPVFAVPFLAEAILLDAAIRDVITCRRVHPVLLDAIDASLQLNRALFMRPDSDISTTSWQILGATLNSHHNPSTSRLIFTYRASGALVQFPTRATPADLMTSISFTQPPSRKVILSSLYGTTTILDEKDGVKLWQVLAEVEKTYKDDTVAVYVPLGLRVVVEYL